MDNENEVIAEVVKKKEDPCLDIDLGLDVFPVFLRDPKTNERKPHALQELSGPDRDSYMNDISARMRYDSKGTPSGMKNFTNFQAGVIARGLFEAEIAEDKQTDPITGEEHVVYRVVSLGKKIDEKVVRAYPGRAQKALFDKLMEMSGLSERSEDLAKND